MNVDQLLQISKDPIWHRWIDGLIILIIGLAAGLVIAGSLPYEEITITTTTTNKVSRPTNTVPEVKSSPKVDKPANAKIEES